MAFCARRVIARAKKDVVIVGVTGSTGKTSAKEALGLVAKHIWRDKAIVAPGNLNNEVGLPLAILDYQDVPSTWQYPLLLFSALLRAMFLKPAKCYVLEYAIDGPGDMKWLTGIAQPNWTVITNITSVHLEYFNNQEELSSEKLQIIQRLPGGSSVIICGDDAGLLKRIKKSRKYAVYRYGKNSENDAKISSIKLGNSTTTFNFHMGTVRREFKINALGEHFALSVAPAIIFGINNKLSPDTVQRAIYDFKPVPGRGNVIVGANNSSIINDTYNANPLSVAAALDLLKQLSAKNKVAVLGDMLELGKESEQAHYDVLKMASKIADTVITVGPRMRQAGGGNINFKSPNEAAKYLKDNIERDSIMLVKGSQSIRMEIVVKAIMANPEIAGDVLPRQSRAWLKKPFIEV